MSHIGAKSCPVKKEWQGSGTGTSRSHTYRHRTRTNGSGEPCALTRPNPHS